MSLTRFYGGLAFPIGRDRHPIASLRPKMASISADLSKFANFQPKCANSLGPWIRDWEPKAISLEGMDSP
ncbi:Protein of unknown function [Pyronema omphalodes CBS 100304]|uniref:Uncharacterized protein n=1 Tax=Pyronema omphalodes (strain CBS 100304) TaxID=1076935 RepID=U4LWS4_PYROM|nr:Protein of unknown function [Pyronema omphalodes CBS 100304]